MNKTETEKILKAGRIVKEVREFIIDKIKPGILLIDLAELIESEIEKRGGKPAFPTNLSINEIAAHYTPSHEDETKSHGLIKVDFGVHIDGWVADNSISIDLDNNEENKKLILSAQESLKDVLKKIQLNSKITLSEIGETIQEKIESYGFTPIINLSGHSIDEYDLHSGLTIPNIKNNSTISLEEGIYAIEPFTTNGNGRVKDGKPSGIYNVINLRNTRNQTSREILNYITEEHGSLPFCSRWIFKKFGSRGLLALRQLEKEGILHQYEQLIESSGGKVAQAEHTILIDNKGKIIITTE
jgi:methionyl aminopeptidase